MALWWYVTRASGFVAWALLTLSVVWGLLLSTKLLGRKPSPAWLLDLHRFLGAATVVFTLVHVVGILADSFVNFDVADVLVPFASGWHPVAVAWGIVGFYLLLAVELTSLLRRRLPQRVWRRVHYASFPLFVSATIHGASAGSDARTTIAALAGLVGVGVIGLLVAARVERARSGPVSAHRPPRVQVLPRMVSNAANGTPAPPRRRYEARRSNSDALARAKASGAVTRSCRPASAPSAAVK